MLNNPVVNSFLQNDADLVFVLKTKAMKKLVKHLNPDEKYAFIERAVDGLPSATIESNMVTYNTQGDQGLFVSITYVPKGGHGDIRGRTNLDNIPNSIFSLDNPSREVGYRLLSYYWALREIHDNLISAFEYIEGSGSKVKKADKRALSLFSRLCWFIYLSLLDIVTTDKEEAAVNSFLGIEYYDGQFTTETGDVHSALVDISTLASELTEVMVREHLGLIRISMFRETGIPFIVMRNSDIEMDLDNVSDEYQAKMDKFIQYYREYLSVHGDQDADDKIKRVICGMRLAYGVMETLRYRSPNECEVIRRYRNTLTNWAVLAKQLYNSVNQF